MLTEKEVKSIQTRRKHNGYADLSTQEQLCSGWLEQNQKIIDLEALVLKQVDDVDSLIAEVGPLEGKVKDLEAENLRIEKLEWSDHIRVTGGVYYRICPICKRYNPEDAYKSDILSGYPNSVGHADECLFKKEESSPATPQPKISSELKSAYKVLGIGKSVQPSDECSECEDSSAKGQIWAPIYGGLIPCPKCKGTGKAKIT